VSLSLPITASTEEVTLERILEFEADRFANSTSYRKFLEEQGFLEDLEE